MEDLMKMFDEKTKSDEGSKESSSTKYVFDKKKLSNLISSYDEIDFEELEDFDYDDFYGESQYYKDPNCHPASCFYWSDTLIDYRDHFYNTFFAKVNINNEKREFHIEDFENIIKFDLIDDLFLELGINNSIEEEIKNKINEISYLVENDLKKVEFDFLGFAYILKFKVMYYIKKYFNLNKISREVLQDIANLNNEMEKFITNYYDTYVSKIETDDWEEIDEYTDILDSFINKRYEDLKSFFSNIFERKYFCDFKEIVSNEKDMIDNEEALFKFKHKVVDTYNQFDDFFYKNINNIDDLDIISTTYLIFKLRKIYNM